MKPAAIQDISLIYSSIKLTSAAQLKVIFRRQIKYFRLLPISTRLRRLLPIDCDQISRARFFTLTTKQRLLDRRLKITIKA